ncbi:MAG: alpha/beta hydrolase [Chloroflexi bacterium]|nr:alpha/beta hydrolase [Chloroflexota bacterium]
MSASALPSLLSRQIQLRDGRRLGYADLGDPAGRPLLFFHGWPASRLFLRQVSSVAASPGVRIIAPDRPGFGLSDFQPGRTLLDWPGDVVELADALGIDRFAVAGHSGGGPYVAACALRIPSRLTAAGIVSGFAPLDAPGATDGMMASNRLMFGLARRMPWLHRTLIALMMSGGPGTFSKSMLSSLPGVDRAVMATFDRTVDDIGEAFRAGVQGPVWDQLVVARPWGFRLEEIAMDVHLWQGDRDVMVPVSMGRYLAAAIPKCHATFCTGEGHMLVFSRWTEILARLLM